MLFKKEETSPDTFWREYEEKTGETVLARGLGKYVSGWDEFDEKKWGGIWGLIISTSGGFRFHHFPQNSWIDAFTSFIKTDPPKDKTIFIPKEKIISSELFKETKWWKKIFSPTPPRLVIKYFNDEPRENTETESAKTEKRLLFEAEYTGSSLMQSSL